MKIICYRCGTSCEADSFGGGKSTVFLTPWGDEQEANLCNQCLRIERVINPERAKLVKRVKEFHTKLPDKVLQFFFEAPSPERILRHEATWNVIVGNGNLRTPGKEGDLLAVEIPAQDRNHWIAGVCDFNCDDMFWMEYPTIIHQGENYTFYTAENRYIVNKGRWCVSCNNPLSL